MIDPYILGWMKGCKKISNGFTVKDQTFILQSNGQIPATNPTHYLNIPPVEGIKFSACVSK